MLKYNFIIFKRQLFKRPAHTLINVLGLIIAFTATTLIYLHLRHELSYDGFHKEADRTYRVAWFGSNPQTRTPHPMAAAMKADMPEVEEAVSLSPLYGPGLTKTTFRFKNLENNIVFDEPEGYLVDSTFFKVFDFELAEGSPAVLEKVGGLLISQTMADRFFGEESPIGKFLAFGSGENLVEVVAVLKDIPTHSHFRPNFLLSYVTSKAQNPTDNWYKWGDFGHFNYIRLAKGVNPKQVEEKIPAFVSKYIEASEEQMRQLESGEIGFRLQPIRDIHLHSHLRWELDENSDISYVYLYGVSALFILLISIINFVNMTTAKSIERLKEVGVKKALGAIKDQLFRQFLLEAALVVGLALVLSLALSYGLVPRFNQLVKGELQTEMLFGSGLLVALLMLGVLVTCLAAFYPSVYLSNSDPGKVLKGGSVAGGPANSKARNVLLGVQFFMTVLLISGSLMIHRQIRYMKDKDLGFDKESTMVVRIKEDDELVPRLKTVKAELLADPNIQQVAAVSNVPGGQFNHNPVFWSEAPENRVTMGEFLVDYDAFSLMDLQMVAGRKFSRSFLADSAGASYILNETAVQRLNLQDPVGKRLNWDDDDRMKVGTIIGVVSDFHFKSLHESISPVIMQIYPDDYNFLLIKTKSQDLTATIHKVQEVYKTYDPVNSFEYYFLDERIEALYHEESRTLDIVTIFSAISIFLSVAGLVGLAMVVIRKRIKEIGIRKVLGASVGQILWLLNTRYLIIAALSLVVAIPTTLYLLSIWLNNFTFQTNLSPMVFVYTAIGVLVVILTTISLISFRSSNSNPVKSLRYE